MKMRIVLISPKRNYPNVKTSRFFCYPIGLASLATYLSRQIPSVKVEVYDQEISDFSLEDITKDANFVGVSDFYHGQHSNALAILYSAKRKNPKIKTIIGGTNTIFTADRIRRNNPFIDFIVNDVCAEQSLTTLLTGKKYSFSLKDSYYDLSHIKTQDKSILENWFPIRSIIGCKKAIKYKRCGFCGLPTQKIQTKNPEAFWKQIALLHDQYGITRFTESGDSFFVGDYPKQLLQARPNNLNNVQIRIYAEPLDLTEQNVELLRALGVDFVFTGIESGSNQMLKKMGKRHTTGDIVQALDNSQKYGLQIGYPLVLGFPGESEQTLRQTYDFTERVFENYRKIITYKYISIVVPIAGSDIFEMCINDQDIITAYNQQGRDLTKDDNMDYALLQKLMIKKHCDVDFRTIKQTKQQIQLFNQTGEISSWQTEVI